jgi:ABC-type transport system substrate-binding protein
MRVVVTILVSLAVALGLGGMASSKPQYGGELIYAFPGEPRSLFTGTVWGWLEMEIQENVYENLVELTPEGELVPWLAKSWEFSEDGSVCTFHLQEGIQYSDGSSFNAESVRFVYTEFMTKHIGAISLLTGIAEIEVVDEYTVAFHFEKPLAAFISNIACEAMALWGPALYKEYGKDYMDTHMLGTGPFILDKWEHGEYIRLVKNPNYWKEGLPYLDAIKYVIVPEEAVRIMMIEAGEADRVINVNDFELARLDANPNIKVRTTPSTRQYYIILNNLRHPLDNVLVRKALNYAVDKKGIVESVFAGGLGASVPKAPTLTESDSFYSDMTEPGKDSLYEYDPKMAARYFALAGFEDRDGDGILEDPYGNDLELKLWGEKGHYKGDVKLFEVLAAMLSDAGIKIDARRWEHATYSAMFRLEPEKAEYDMGVLAWGIPTGDPDEVVMNLYYSYTKLPRPGINRMFYGNPKVDELADAQHYAVDPTKRQALINKWAETILADAPVIFMPTLNLNLVTRTYLHGDSIMGTECFPHKFAWFDHEEMERQGISR